MRCFVLTSMIIHVCNLFQSKLFGSVLIRYVLILSLVRGLITRWCRWHTQFSIGFYHRPMSSACALPSCIHDIVQPISVWSTSDTAFHESTCDSSEHPAAGVHRTDLSRETDSLSHYSLHDIPC